MRPPSVLRTYRSELEDEVVSRDDHAIREIEAMRIEAWHAGIELEAGAALRSSPVDQPREQSLAVAFRALSGRSHEVIHVQEPAAHQILEKSKSCDRSYLPAFAKIGKVFFA
jgi:hypothetical protein